MTSAPASAPGREPGDRHPRPGPLTRALSALARAGRPGRVLAPEIDSLRRLRWHGAGRGSGASEHAKALSRAHDQAYERIWAQAARALGAELRELGDGFLVISRGGVETVVRRHLVMINDAATAALAIDKSLVHRLLRAEGLPVPPYVEVERADPAAASAFASSAEGPCVVKPASGTSGGTGVTCGVRSAEDLSRAWLAAGRWDSRLLVERQGTGEEYRLLFLEGQLIGSVRRGRPHVIGDGSASVLELIERENLRRLSAGSEDVSRVIRVDLDCELAVRHSGCSLRSVPARGQRVAVKSTVGENAAAENSVVEDLSPELVAEAARACELLHLRLGGVDLVTPDRAVSLTQAGGAILEVNATPGLHYHYQVDVPGRVYPVAVPILERLLAAH